MVHVCSTLCVEFSIDSVNVLIANNCAHFRIDCASLQTNALKKCPSLVVI